MRRVVFLSHSLAFYWMFKGLSLTCCNNDSKVVIKEWEIHWLTTQLSVHLNLQQTQRKCTKSLYVYVCVLEHNASTLELLRQMRERREKKEEGEASEEETQLLKPCVQSADNQNRGWDPKCIMGDPTWLAVLLLSALSFSSLLWSVLAYFPE